MSMRCHASVEVLVEAARLSSRPAKQAVVEMGSPSTVLPALVKRRREHRVTGVWTRTVSRSLELVGANAQGSRETARGEVTQRTREYREENIRKRA